MSDKQVFFLRSPSVRQAAARAIQEAFEGYRVEIAPPAKSRDQEALYHSLFAEVSKTRQFMGKSWDAETWKRLLVDAYARIRAAEGKPLTGYGQMVPSLDGAGFVQLGVQTRRFTKDEASEFIDFLHAWMAAPEAT